MSHACPMVCTSYAQKVGLHKLLPRLIAACCANDVQQQQASWRSAIEAEKALKKVRKLARMPCLM